MDIRVVTGGPVDVNTYILSQDGHCLLIDPGAQPDQVRSAVGSNIVDAVLLTHGHYDHIYGLAAWQDQGIPVLIHELDADFLTDAKLNLSALMGMPISLKPASQLLHEGDLLDICGLCIKVLHTPGHTPGSVCFLIGKTLFSGDTMFYHSYGRVDFPGGNPGDMYHSLKRLQTLDPETAVYPGHGEMTTIRDEHW